MLHSGQAAELYSLQYQEIIIKNEQEREKSSSEICSDIKVQENKFIVVDELELAEVKTKEMQKFLKT